MRHEHLTSPARAGLFFCRLPAYTLTMHGMARAAQETRRGTDAAAISAKRFKDGAQDAARLTAQWRNNLQGVARTARDASRQVGAIGRGMLAFKLYGDHTRARELVRINPQVRNPNFIAKGQELLVYAK